MAAYREPMSLEAKSPESARARAQAQAQAHSPWHSPVPYLFGGLAAMLGLIAFALMILACSYWKLSGYLEGERDLEAGEAKNEETQIPGQPEAYQETFLVIQPGHKNPTVLATPAFSTPTSSFDGRTCTCDCDISDKPVEMAETVKQGSGGPDQVQLGNTDTQDTSTDHSC